MIRCLAATAALCLFVATPAQSQCARIDDDLDRLACYDREAGRTPAVTVQPPLSSEWKVSESTSPLTDERTVLLVVEADEPHQCSIRGRETARLALRCHENTTALIITTGCHMASGFQGYGDVDYRIDDKPAQSVAMDASTSNDSLGLWRGGRSIPVIRSMLGGSRMVVRMQPYGQNPIMATFTIAGLDEVLPPLREACNW